MKTKHTTLKENESLLEFCNKYNKPIKEVTKMVIDNLIRYNLIYDSDEFCGDTIEFIINESHVYIDAFIVCTFGVNGMTMQNLIKQFQIWNVKDECPECGCELDQEQYITKCTNCDYWQSFEPDYDSMKGGRDYKADLENINYN